MKFFKPKSYLLFSSFVALCLTAPAVVAMEDNDEALHRKGAVFIKTLRENLNALVDCGNYTQTLKQMERLGLPDIALDGLSPDGHYDHPYIYDITYNYMHSCMELAESQQSTDVKTSSDYYKRAITSGQKYMGYYKDRDEDEDLRSGVITILEKLVMAHYLLSALFPIENELMAQNARNLLDYDRMLIGKVQSHGTPQKLLIKRCNYLNHMFSYFPVIKDEAERIFYLEEIDRIMPLTEANPTFYKGAIGQRKIIDERLKEKTVKTTRPLLSKKGRTRLAQIKAQREVERCTTHVETNREALPPSGLLMNCIYEIVEMEKASDLHYLASKRKATAEFSDSKKKLATKISDVEHTIFKFVSPGSEYKVTKENLILIYQKGSEIMDIPWRQRLSLNIICFMNAQDFENAVLRSQVSESIKGNLSKEEKIVLALCKFMLGDPKDWDQLMQERKQKNNKRNLARRKRVAESIKSNLDDSQRGEKEKEQVEIELAENEKGTKKVEKEGEKEGGNFEPSSIDGSAVQSPPILNAPRAEKVKTKKTKHWSDYEMRYVRNPSVSQAVEKEKIKGEEEESERVRFILSNSPFNLYMSLYSRAPRFTSEGAGQLLEAFGMKVENGKGSHKKYTFRDSLDGQRIVDEEQKEIFQFPDFVGGSYAQGSMMVIPRWNRDNPPHYIIGALRYILEKRGAKQENVFKESQV